MKIQTAKSFAESKTQSWLEKSEKAFRFSQTEALLQLLINPFKLAEWRNLPFANCDGIYDCAEFIFDRFEKGNDEVKSAICDLIEFAEKDWKESQKNPFVGETFLFQHALENWLWAFDFQEDSAMRLFLERKLLETDFDSLPFEIFEDLHSLFFSKGNTSVLVDFLKQK
tara:strand:+ start:113 stop:619 length:507 start_codon:yes stop_codon:yes gene_type:complete